MLLQIQYKNRIEANLPASIVSHCFSCPLYAVQSTGGVGANHAVIVLFTMTSDYSKNMQMLNLTGENLILKSVNYIQAISGKAMVV